MRKTSFYIINALTFYRLIASLFLILLLFIHQPHLFKWLLAISFFTDYVDGFLARKYKVTSVLGAKIDSIADDFTVLAAIIGMIVLKPDFIRHETTWILILLALYLIQTSLAFIRYKRMTNFHTYMAKVAALLQGIFFILLFFMPEWPLTVFKIAAIVTLLDLTEEIVLVLLLPRWQTNVKGLIWVIHKNKLHQAL